MKLRLLASLLTCSHAVCAAAPDWKLSQLNRKVWQIEDGLPHNYVAAITTDDQGYLLVGTSSGIARFDGVHFTPFEPLSGTRIYTLLRASDGGYWASESNALYKLIGGKIQARFDTGGQTGIIHSLVEDRSHRIWAVSPKGLLRIDRTGLTMVVHGSNVDGYKAQAIAQDDSGAIWFAAEEGLFRVDRDYTGGVRLRGVQGKPLSVYYHQGLYLGTTTGLYVLKCSASSCEGSAVPEVAGPVADTLAASDGALWVATWGNGIYRCANQRSSNDAVEHLTTQQGLADDFVRVLKEDREHNIWAGTRSGGLTRFRQTMLKPFGIPEGLGGNYASAVIGDGADGLWLGTWRSGLFHWRNGTMSPQPLPQQPLGLLISSLGRNARNDLWIGSYQGLWRIRAGNSTAERITVPHDKITDLLVTRDHSLWLASERLGLRQFPSGSPETSAPNQFLEGESVTTLLEDRVGVIWAGTKAGLWRMNQRHQFERLGQTWTTALAEDSRGRVWAAAIDGKIQVFTKTGAVPFLYAGLPAPAAYSIATDTFGALWLGTGRGLARASNRDVEEFLAGRQPRVELIAYGVSEGMRTIECRGDSAQPSTWKRADGTVWLPTSRGFLEIDPAPPEYNDLPPKTYIEDLRIDGKTVAPNAQIRLEPGDHELIARFTAIRLSRGERLQFRYRMQGLDQDWVEAGTERIARYRHFRAGQFTLLVSARDPGGSWSEPVTSASIEQLPFFYQTVWFQVLAAALIACLTVLIYRLHLGAVRKRYQAVLDERTRIAREWHDTLLAGLSAASWQLGVASEQCSDGPESSSIKGSIKSAAGMVRYCRDEARRAIGELRCGESAPPNLADSLREAVCQLTDCSPVRPRFEVEGKIPACDIELNTDILRICQEAASNVLQHAHASEVLVRLDCGHRDISLSVQDNGIGIDAQSIDAPPHGHYGLLGMRERVKRFGGQLYISSKPGSGTLVKAVVPIPR